MRDKWKTDVGKMERKTKKVRNDEHVECLTVAEQMEIDDGQTNGHKMDWWRTNDGQRKRRWTESETDDTQRDEPTMDGPRQGRHPDGGEIMDRRQNKLGKMKGQTDIVQLNLVYMVYILLATSSELKKTIEYKINFHVRSIKLKTGPDPLTHKLIALHKFEFLTSKCFFLKNHSTFPLRATYSNLINSRPYPRLTQGTGISGICFILSVHFVWFRVQESKYILLAI